MRITSYNIRKSVGLDWQRNPQRIIHVLAEINADIAVLQEADKRVGSRSGTLCSKQIEQHLQMCFVDAAVRPQSHGWHGNAILHKPDYHVEDIIRIDLPVLEPRGALAVDFSHPMHGNFTVIGTHLALAARVRSKQVQHLVNFLVEEKPQQPIIVAGDFNEWSSNGKSCQPFNKQFTMVSPGPTFHTSLPVAPLDRFILSNNITMLDCGVHHSPLAKRASDHLPIYVKLQL